MKDIISWVHFGDLHIADWQDQNYTDFLNLIGEVNRYLTTGVDFALLPGDNADDGEEDQFELVQRAITRCRLPVYSIAGDHDCASGDLDCFARYLSPLPYQSFARGGYHFALLNSVACWRAPRFGLGSEQIGWLEDDLATAAEDGLRSVLFMHAYPSEHDEDADAISCLIRRHRVLVVDMGHTHYNELASDGQTVYATTRSTGQIEEGSAGVSIVTVDHSVVSWKFKPIFEWPLAMVTSPSDHRLIIDTECPQQLVRGLIDVRARVWGEGIASVRLRVGGREPVDMASIGEAVWSVEWDSVLASDDLHWLVVEVSDRSGRVARDAIRVLVNQARDYRPPTRCAVDSRTPLALGPRSTSSAPSSGRTGMVANGLQNESRGVWPS